MEFKLFLNSLKSSLPLFFRQLFDVLQKRLILILTLISLLLLVFAASTYYQKVYLALEHEPVGDAKAVRINEKLLEETAEKMKAREEQSKTIVLPGKDIFR